MCYVKHQCEKLGDPANERNKDKRKIIKTKIERRNRLTIAVEGFPNIFFEENLRGSRNTDRLL